QASRGSHPQSPLQVARWSMENPLRIRHDRRRTRVHDQRRRLDQASPKNFHHQNEKLDPLDDLARNRPQVDSHLAQYPARRLPAALRFHRRARRTRRWQRTQHWHWRRHAVRVRRLHLDGPRRHSQPPQQPPIAGRTLRVTPLQESPCKKPYLLRRSYQVHQHRNRTIDGDQLPHPRRREGGGQAGPLLHPRQERPQLQHVRQSQRHRLDPPRPRCRPLRRGHRQIMDQGRGPLPSATRQIPPLPL
ncbi:uncharacterized protein METZ01_LOCUS308670, partial [marine metagenome]